MKRYRKEPYFKLLAPVGCVNITAQRNDCLAASST